MKPYYGLPKIAGQPWVSELLSRSSFTAREALVVFMQHGGPAKYPADIVNRLRQCEELELTTLGPVEGGHHRERRYQLRRKDGPRSTDFC